MEEQEKISVTICGRSYPLKVAKDEVESFHQIASEINTKVQRLQAMYSNKDLRDCLSMAVLTYAVDLHKKQGNASDSDLSSLSRLEQLLDQYA